MPEISTNQFSAVLESVIYRIMNTPLNTYPFPHLFIENIFPEHFFHLLRSYLPTDPYYISLSETGTVAKGQYKERFCFAIDNPKSIERLPIAHRLFWHNFTEQFLSSRFIDFVMKKLEPFLDLHPFIHAVKKQFKHDWRSQIEFEPNVRLLRDRDQYRIGPHTDSIQRLASLLFYLPQHAEWVNAGTSLYVPKNEGFRCKGGPHYPFHPFDRIFTAPYLPNSLLFFMKTDQSFHGVEKIHMPHICRDQVLYYIQLKNV